MSLLQFIVTYLLMVICGCLFTIGWYIVTRGEWYIQPDGKWKKYGQIFKNWSLFWEQYRQEKKIYYREEELKKKMDLLAKVRPDLYTVTSVWRGVARKLTKEDMPAIKDVLACEVKWVASDEFLLYLTEPVYTFPAWIRKPLSQCPTCMSSVYGSLLYWFVIAQAKGIFAWSLKENLAKFGFWIIFCLILACGNDYLSQKLKL